MDELKESIKEKIEGAFADMSAHSDNGYTDESEYIVVFTVEQLKWLSEELGCNNYHLS